MAINLHKRKFLINKYHSMKKILYTSFFTVKDLTNINLDEIKFGRNKFSSFESLKCQTLSHDELNDEPK